MKRWLVIGGVIIISALLLTKDYYINIYEFMIIIIGSSSIALITRPLWDKRRVIATHVSSALIAFIIYWILSFTDLVGDHYLYFLPTGNEDGAALTIGEQILEFSDDLLMVSYMAPVLVFIISILMNRLTITAYRK